MASLSRVVSGLLRIRAPGVAFSVFSCFSRWQPFAVKMSFHLLLGHLCKGADWFGYYAVVVGLWDCCSRKPGLVSSIASSVKQITPLVHKCFLSCLEGSGSS